VAVLDECFVNSEGELDRLVLQEVMRRPIVADKDATKTGEGDDSSSFYDIDGDYFVLRYSETITRNIQYVKLTSADNTIDHRRFSRRATDIVYSVFLHPK
jgi:hypothetical protein